MSKPFVELAQHLRYCICCHDFDDLRCPTGRRLWLECGLDLEVPYPIPRDAGDFGLEVDFAAVRGLFKTNS